MNICNVVSKVIVTVIEFLNQHFPSAPHLSVIILQSRLERPLTRPWY